MACCVNPILFKKSAAVCPPGLNCHISPLSDVNGLSGLGGNSVGEVDDPGEGIDDGLFPLEINTQPGIPVPEFPSVPGSPLLLVCTFPSLSVVSSFSLKAAQLDNCPKNKVSNNPIMKFIIFFIAANATIAAAIYPIYFKALPVYLSSNFGIVATTPLIPPIRPFAASNLSFKNIAVPSY